MGVASSPGGSSPGVLVPGEIILRSWQLCFGGGWIVLISTLLPMHC